MKYMSVTISPVKLKFLWMTRTIKKKKMKYERTKNKGMKEARIKKLEKCLDQNIKNKVFSLLI